MFFSNIALQGQIHQEYGKMLSYDLALAEKINFT